MEVVHQGYLHCNIGIPAGSGESNNLRNVYVVLSTKDLVCYSENPALQHPSQVNIVGSFNLKHTRVADSTVSKRPKSFEVFSTRDHSIVEFVCPTNSVKFQWVKQLQVQTCSAVPSPNDRKAETNSFRNSDGDMNAAESAIARIASRSVHGENPSPHAVSKLTASRNLAAKVLTPVPRISYNTNLLDRPANRPDVLSATNNDFIESPKRREPGVIETHPKWVPGNFGNKQHSSLALASPGPTRTSPRAQSADRSTRNSNYYPVDDEYRPENSGSREIRRTGLVAAQPLPRSSAGVNPTPSRAAPAAEYDVLASRAAPNRAKSATPTARSLHIRNQRTVFDAQTPRSSSRQQHSQGQRQGLSAATTPTHQQAANFATPSNKHQNDDGNSSRYKEAPLASPAPFIDPSAQLMAKSMSDMTVSEIRAALLSMPAMVRQSLVQTPPPQHSVPFTAQPTRRGSYEDRHAYTPGNNQSHVSQHSASMTHEEYLEARRHHGGNRRNSEQYERFMGDSYPAVGDFYPGEHEREYETEPRMANQRQSQQDRPHRAQQPSQEHQYGEESSAEEEEEDAHEEEEEDYEGQEQHHYAHPGETLGGREQMPRQRHEYSAEQRYGRSYEPTNDVGAASDSDFPPQEYGRSLRDEDDGEYRDHHQQYDRRHARSQDKNVLPPGNRSTNDEYGRATIKNKPQLPEAARRGTSASPSRRIPRDIGGASDRESRIPRPTEASPRGKKSSAQQINSRHEDTDDYDSSIAPSRGAKTSARAASAQRVPAKQQRSHSPQPAWGSNAHNNSSSINSKSRAVSAGSVGESGRPRYLPEAERKQALEWSRKQAWEKKLRTDFSGSPLRSASPSNAAPVLKLKYRSFHSSVEKETTSSIEDVASGDRYPNPDGRHRQDLHIETGVRPEGSHKLSALEKDVAVQEAVGAIARSRARANNMQSQSGHKTDSKSEHINYSANAFSKKPESFFSFRNNRTGAAAQPETKEPSHPQHRHNNDAGVRNSSPPLKPRPASVPTAPPAHFAIPVAESSPRANSIVQMQAGQQARKSPELSDRQNGATTGSAPSIRRDENTMTNVAEWRRLTEWLTRIGMHRYIDVLRANGVTKLSLVELMVPEDMEQIGIAPEDIAVIHSKVTEFTNRTRSFSEQVLNRGSQSPSSDINAFPPVPTLGAVPVPSQTASKSTQLPGHQQGNPSISNVSGRPRPSQPPPHLASQPVGGHRGKTPFAQRNNQPTIPINKNKGQSLATLDAVQLSDVEAGAEPVLESVRIATEEHIFSDVREIRSELLRCFESGERELFLHAWKQLTLYMPDDCNMLNPQRPSMFNAKQVMEFHLHLHFAVFPITHNLGKTAEKQGKLALRRYLESIMLTSELDSLNQLNDMTPRSAIGASEPAEKSTAPNAEEGHALLLDTNLLNMTAASSVVSPNTPFTRTREYAVYAGMVLVPDPQENVAFQALFQPQWMQSLKERLGQFLTLVSPNVEILPTMTSTAANSSAGSVVGAPPDNRAVLESASEDAPAVAAAHEDIEVSNTSYSSKVQVRTYLEPAIGATPPPSSGRLDDFEIAFTSPVNHKHGEGMSSPMPSDNKFASNSPLSPIALDTTTKMMEDVVSPLEMSPSEVDVPRKRIVNTKLAEETASLAKLTGLASPVSAVSSVISQLTDDDYPRSNIAAAAAALRAEEGLVVATQGLKSSEKKPKLKPFSSVSKSAMQSQVDVYNKLLKRSASPKVVSSEAAAQNNKTFEAAALSAESPSTAAAAQSVSPAAFRTTRRVAAASTNQPRGNAAALNVGFGLKRRPAPDASSAQQADQSLAAQVARYNKLLVSSNSLAAEASASAQPDPQEISRSPVEATGPELSVSPTPLPNGFSEDTAEDTLSASEAHRVEEVLLEMQHIYSNTTGEEVVESTSTAGHVDAVPSAPSVPAVDLSEQVEQKIEQHGQQLMASTEAEVEPTQLVVAE